MHFLIPVILTSLFSSISFGIVGSMVVVKRIVFIGGALAHAALGGIGLAFFLQDHFGLMWFSVKLGVFIIVMIASIIFLLLAKYDLQRDDTILGAVWALGMALGPIFLSQTKGLIDPTSYLFGNLALISTKDIIGSGITVMVIILIVTLFYNKLVALIFDQLFLRSRGVKVMCYNALLIFMVAFTIIFFLDVVGILLVVAMLSLPAGIATLFFNSMKQIMIASSLICFGCSILGIGFSYFYNIPLGPITVVLMAMIFFVVSIFFKK